MSENSWRRITFASAIGIVILVITGLLAGGTSASGDGDGDGDGNGDKTPKLYVDPAKVPAEFCLDIVRQQGGKLVTLDDGSKTPKFMVGATRPVGNGPAKRLWSDATNVPLRPKTTQAAQAVLCSDPGQAAMFMNAMRKVKASGSTVAEINSHWMKAQGSPSVINQWAQGCLTDDVDKHLACAKTMSYTAYLLGMFKAKGVQQRTSAWNYHVVGATVGKVPEFRMSSKQYRGYFLVYSYTEKAVGPCVEFGINVGKGKPNGGDQRMAGFTCVPDNPPPSNPPTGPPPTDNPPCVHNCNPTEPPSNPPTETPCDCPDLNDAEQPVPTPDDNDAPTQEPSSQPTHPVDPDNPPDPNDGGYDGGSTDQPGQSGNPDPAVPSSDPTNTGDPGGF